MSGQSCSGRAPLFDAVIDGETERQRVRRYAYAMSLCETCPRLAACRASIDWRREDGVIGGILLPAIPDRDRRGWRVPL